MTDNHEQDLRELLLPYVLRQLDAAERARVEQALDADAGLRRELEELEAIGARVVASVPHTPAPAELKGRVMAAVRAGAERPALEGAASPSSPAPAAEPTPIGRARSAPRRRWFAMPALAGSLAAACIALAIVATDLDRDLDAARDRADRLEAAASDRGGAPAGFEDATPYKVSTNSQFKDTSGSLIRVSRDKWILLFNNVPAPAVGKSWQVWTADSNGLIQNVAQWRSGSTQLLVLDRADIKEVMVSYEPTTRPAPVPSSAPVADVKV